MKLSFMCTSLRSCFRTQMPLTTPRPTCQQCQERPVEKGSNGTHWRKVCSGCRRPRYATKRRRALGLPARGVAQPRHQGAKYGLTEDEFNAMRQKQNCCCAICYRPEKLVIDHDHATGIVRGLLCHHCNVALGFFRDEVDVMREAITYLEVQRSPSSFSTP